MKAEIAFSFQVNIYARFTNQENIERQNTFARAVCSNNLYDIYYSGTDSAFVYSIVTSTIILPLVFCIIFIASVRNMKSTTVNYITKSSNHRHLVALAYIGMMISLFVVITDILACYTVATNRHEYAMEITKASLNLSIVYVTLVLDIIFILPSFLCMLYIFYINIAGCEDRKMSGKFIRGFFKVLIGEKSFIKIEATSDKEVVAFILPILFATPLLCTFSHIGYILLSWVTEPSKSTANFILYYLIVVFFYIAFRKFYALHEKTHLKWCFLEPDVKQENPREINRREVIELDVISTNDPDGSTPAAQGEVSAKRNHKKRACCCLSVVKVQTNYINPQAFFFLVFYSVLVVSIIMSIIFIFLFLPISSESLITYLFNALQLLVVLITTQIAFRLVFSSDFNLREAVKSFHEQFARNKDEDKVDGKLVTIATDKNLGLEKATGAVVAEFTNIAMRRNGHYNS